MNEIPKWHFSMLNDVSRNESFARAISKQVSGEHKVVDIGAGTGLLSLIARDNGAATVDAFEANEAMAQIAQRVISNADVEEHISLHRTHSTNINLRANERKNFLLTETFDCALIGEGILPTLRHARKYLLESKYKAIPARGTLLGCLLSSPEIRRLNEVSSASGIDVSELNRLQTRGHFPVRLETWQHEFCSQPAELFTLDLLKEPPGDGAYKIPVTATKTALVDGVVAWFELDLGAGEVVSNSPGTLSHWMQAFIPLPRPVQVTADQQFILSLEIHDQTKFAATGLRPLANASQDSASTLSSTNQGMRTSA
ncbi:50S ribosomal protein L11 methyltransferase [Luteipulveratus halotolerans]|uniref:50S ribosomal protein L11 methyltransferase n=1 Tax=Luteipulveratus halotolerans TaxID=1631356 RepID=UPI0012FCA1A8|nr:50S ribosomal protein L11 methyltransferase [Luteipulveratus halotolerans]